MDLEKIDELREEVQETKLMLTALISVLHENGIVTNKEMKEKQDYLEANNLVTVGSSANRK